MWTLVWCQFWLKMWALFEMGMLGTTYGLKCELLYKMWVLVSPDLAARDFLAAVGTETTFWEQVSWPTFNQGFRHCSRIWKLRWWTQSHHFVQIGDTGPTSGPTLLVRNSWVPTLLGIVGCFAWLWLGTVLILTSGIVGCFAWHWLGARSSGRPLLLGGGSSLSGSQEVAS